MIKLSKFIIEKYYIFPDSGCFCLTKDGVVVIFKYIVQVATLMKKTSFRSVGRGELEPPSWMKSAKELRFGVITR